MKRNKQIAKGRKQSTHTHTLTMDMVRPIHFGALDSVEFVLCSNLRKYYEPTQTHFCSECLCIPGWRVCRVADELSAECSMRTRQTHNTYILYHWIEWKWYTQTNTPLKSKAKRDVGAQTQWACMLAPKRIHNSTFTLLVVLRRRWYALASAHKQHYTVVL